MEHKQQSNKLDLLDENTAFTLKRKWVLLHQPNKETGAGLCLGTAEEYS